nr:UvrD-helicase domain-containing protein [Chloroflexota bacterium]
ADERERCARAVGEIDLAAIQTIHAFCGSLLRTYPLEAGLPPGFTTLDEIEQDVLFDDRFREWFWTTALQPPARDVLRRALLLGLTQDHLRELALALERQHDLLTAETAWPAPEPGDAVAAAHDAGRALADLEALLGYALDGTEDPLARSVLGAQAGARRLLDAGTVEEALAAMRRLGKLATPGNQRSWGRLPDGRNACAAIKAALNEVNGALEAVLEGHRAATFAAILGLLRDFTLANVAARKADGVAGFQDLLAWARDLLRHHAEVRRRAQEQYRRIFVDEFQDTDPLQAEIAFYLAADPDASLRADWRDIPLIPGKLFIVGDPKQSIYRFRRADIAVYDGLLRRLGDAQERLVQNFRSVSPVIDWVNHHFAAQMQERGGIQPPYVALEARWAPFEGADRCGVYRVGQPSEDSAAAVAVAEMETLAALARTAVSQCWQVSERGPNDSRTLRDARYRDVAILMPARTHLRRLERSLEEAGVPYRVESGRLVLATQEVRDLLAGLRAVEDPSDQVALVGALRSPAYGCSDPDLLRWVEGGGRLSHESPGDGPSGPVNEALISLAAFHARRHVLSPPALIEAYIGDRLLVAAAFGEPRPRESWRRLRYVVSRARQFTATGRHTLRAFLDWIEGLERAEARDVESAEAEPDEDAVRILTIHKSKGLEFPIVLLAGLGAARGGRSQSVEVIPDRTNGALACRAGPAGQAWRTADFETAQLHERAMEEAESVRLLYVAATRARDHLVISLYRTARATTSAAALITDHLHGAEGLCTEIAPVRSRPIEPPVIDYARSDAASGWGTAEFEETWLAHRQELVCRLAAPAVVADNGLEDELWLLDDERPDGDESSAARRDVARAVRTLLRRANGTTLPTTDADPTVIALARAILSSDGYTTARANPRCRDNVPLLGTIDGVLLDLTADLLYETPDGTVLVGYDLYPVDAGVAEAGQVVGDAVSRGRERAEYLALAFLAATGQVAHSVEVIRATDGQTIRLEGVHQLMAEARAGLLEAAR